MTRMGHDDMRAALIYQHASNEADRAIADRLSGLVDQYRKKGSTPVAGDPEKDDGAAGVFVPSG